MLPEDKEEDMANLHVNKSILTGIFISLMMFSFSGSADDIEDSIEEALQYYQSGEYQDSVESLNYASQLIQQKKGEGLIAYLPEPLDGWTAQEGTSQSAGAAMFGGGVTVEREYRKGSGSISIQLITDSPLMQGMMMMFSNPMIATSDGGKLEKIGRQKAIVKYDDASKHGEIMIVLANRYLISIEGYEVTKEVMKEYAKAIDYKKLKSLP